MRSAVSGGLLSAFVIVGFSSGVSAQSMPVERSGNTFHRAVCGLTVGRVARCHAHVVTDTAGRALAYAQPPVSGYGPSSLRDAYKVTAGGNSSTIIAIVD